MRLRTCDDHPRDPRAEQALAGLPHRTLLFI
jgi:hypothetical protein